jgi:N-methylhydantoinase A/oxoprolinase/acetone carboxylase beta subunit|tara:strand:- start:1481 stop:1639 length:159 start_codon:yes stop_codon:yes gene_type:complete
VSYLEDDELIRAGSDIGGTFAHVVFYDDSTKPVRLSKVPGTRQLERREDGTF